MGIEVEGLKEFNAAIRKAVDSDLRKRIGQSNKEIGQLIISKLEPRPVPQAVGQGAGAAIRPSATAREVVLKAGGKHRAKAAPMQQWGRVHVASFGAAPKRPFIMGTAMKHQEEIEKKYLEGVIDAVGPAFYEAKES